MKKFFLSITILLFFVAVSNAQNTSPYWSLAGNSNATSSSKLGTTNAINLRILTNNAERIRVTTAGLIGINTTAPNSRLHINSTTGQNPLRCQVNGSTKFFVDDLGGVTIGSSTTPPANGLYVGGSIGLGTSTPQAKLQISKGTFVSLSSPGYLVLGDIAGYNMGIDNNVIQARYNGTASHLYLNYYGGYTYLGASAALQISNTGVTTTQLLGVNGSSNASYALTVNASSSRNGINVTDGGSAYAFNSTKSGSLAGIYMAKTNASSFDACVWGRSTGSAYGVEGNSGTGIGIYGTTGNSASYAGYFAGNVYSTGNFIPSDLKLKQSIKDFTKAIDIIDKLHPKIYQYRDDENFKMMNLPKGERYGLIAEDLEKVLPNLVKQTKFETATDEDRMKGTASPAIDFKAVNYTELIPILIKGMQEQNAKIKEQQTQNENLQSQIDELKFLVGKLTSQSTNTTSLSTAFLKQNVPNPAGNNTVISYFIPDNAGYAQIRVVDVKGGVLKSFNAAKGDGQIIIRAGELPAGTYNYTLYINNKTVDTKQMVLLK